MEEPATGKATNSALGCYSNRDFPEAESLRVRLCLLCHSKQVREQPTSAAHQVNPAGGFTSAPAWTLSSLSLHLHLHVAANNLKTLYLVLNQETRQLQSEQGQADSPQIKTMVRDPALAPHAGTLSLLVDRLQWHLQV